MFVVGILIALFLGYILLGGGWSRLFWRPSNLNIGLEVQNEGSLDAYRMKNFGPVKQITSGDKKGQIILPRPQTSFKTRDSPQLSIVLGKGRGVTVNPFVPEYIRRMGGAWPEWSGTAPPKQAKDLYQMLEGYAEWKAKNERPRDLAEKKKEFVQDKLAELEPPINADGTELTKEATDKWIQDQTVHLEEIFDDSGGSFKTMLKQIRDPTFPRLRKNGIFEYLTNELISEPADLWPTWIAGHQVSMQDVAQFAASISAAEVQDTVNKITDFLAKKNRGDLVKIMVFALAFVMVMVGAAIAYTVFAK